MPRKDVKKRIIDNLEEYADKILVAVASVTDEDCAPLFVAMQAAHLRYKGKGVASWFYVYTRTRNSDIELALNSMGSFPDPYTRLQEFQLLVGRGEWNHGSYNYYLMDELSKVIPGYKPLTVDEAGTVIQRLGFLIFKKTKLLLSEYADNQSSKERKSQYELSSGLTLFPSKVAAEFKDKDELLREEVSALCTT